MLTMEPVVPPPEALDELKAWLRIATATDDGLLGDALAASILLCEQFTGRVTLIRDAVEVQGVTGDWQTLAAAPVVAISRIDGLIAEGPDVLLPPAAYALDIRDDGRGRVRVPQPGAAGRIRLTYSVGIAASWAALPATLRQGVLRHAAHLQLERGAGEAVLPAAIAALWRPHRRMAL